MCRGAQAVAALQIIFVLICAIVVADPAGGGSSVQAAKRIIDHGPAVIELDAWSFWPRVREPGSLLFVKFFTHDCRCVLLCDGCLQASAF